MISLEVQALNKRKRSADQPEHASRPSSYQPPLYYSPLYDLIRPTQLPSPSPSPPARVDAIGLTYGYIQAAVTSAALDPVLQRPSRESPPDIPGYETPTSSQNYSEDDTRVDSVKVTTTPPHSEDTNLLLSDHDSHHLDFPDAPPTKSGGSCEVYLATYKPGNLVLAMKRPRVDFPTEDMLRRFRREAEIWSTFKHNNVLPFFGTLKIDHRLYLVSPWMPLGDLLAFLQAHVELIQQGKDLRDESVHPAHSKFSEARTIYEIAAGLAYLHALDVVHGDMKAKNVLLNIDGCAKICDFGLAKTTDHAVTSTEFKGVGSLRWQSPELLRNVAKSPKSDVYAFGMTISEVLTGNYPFPHLKQQTAVLFAVMNDNERPAFWPLSRLGVDFEPFWKLAAKCWQTEAEDRPSMEDVLQQLNSMALLTDTSGTLDHPTALPGHGVQQEIIITEKLMPRSRSPSPANLSTSHSDGTPHLGSTGAPAERSKPPQLPLQPPVSAKHPSLPNVGPMRGRPTAVSRVDSSSDSEDSRFPVHRSAGLILGWDLPPRILLVDDDLVSRRLFSKFLQVLECTTDVAVNGIEAVTKIKLEKYDLVFMDIFMPQMDGASATSQIRQFDDETPIIAMTSHSKPNEVLNYFSHGMDDILAKPFTKEMMLAMLEKHLIHLKTASPVDTERSDAPLGTGDQISNGLTSPKGGAGLPTPMVSRRSSQRNTKDLSTEPSPVVDLPDFSIFDPKATIARLLSSTKAESPENPRGAPSNIRRSTGFNPNWQAPPCVLLVEDDQVSRRLFSKFLQVAGCKIDVAVDGIGAVNKMNLEKYDLVLMDIVMPKLDGASATSLIRQFDRATPIIAMTCYSKPDEVVHYFANGMNDILPKPFTKEILLAMLEKHLEHLKASPRVVTEEGDNPSHGGCKDSTAAHAEIPMKG